MSDPTEHYMCIQKMVTETYQLIGNSITMSLAPVVQFSHWLPDTSSIFHVHCIQWGTSFGFHFLGIHMIHFNSRLMKIQRLNWL